MAGTPTLLICLILVAVTGRVCQGQNNADQEKGVILTVQPNNPLKSVHLRHLNINPPYDVVNDRIRVPGLRFSTPEMHFLSVEMDYRRKEVFLYDIHFKTIFIGVNYNAPLQLTQNNMTFHVLHSGISTGAVQLAYDWLSGSLYWVDSVFKWIAVCPGAYEKLEQDYYNILITGNLDHPEGLSVDPLSGYMFFSDNGDFPKIERARLDGTERTKFDISGLVTPESLEVDVYDKRLYIVDTGAERVISCNYDGKDQKLVRRFSQSILTDAAIYRESLYLTNIRTGALYIVNKTSGSLLIDPIRLRDETIYGVAVYKEEVQPLRTNATTNCTVLACDHLCITTATGAKCMCSEGFKFNTTTKRCQEDLGKLHRAIVLASSTKVCLADIRSLSKATAAYSPVCIYTTDPDEIPTTTTSTTTTTATTTTPTTTTMPTTPRTSPTTPRITTQTTTPTTVVTHSDHSVLSSTKTTTPTTRVPTTRVRTTRATSTRAPTTPKPTFPSTMKTTVPPTASGTKSTTPAISTAKTQGDSSSTPRPSTTPGRRRRRRKRQATQTTVPTSTLVNFPPFPPSIPTSKVPAPTIARLAVNSHARHLYIATSDGKINRRPIDLAIEDTQIETLTNAAGDITGLVYDWVSQKNVFWCESNTGNFYLFDTEDFAVRKVNFDMVTKSPSELNILAHERKLIWVAMDTNSSIYDAIYTSDLTGENVHAIISGRKNITSLTVDQEKRLIYFLEGSPNSQVYSIGFEGHNMNEFTTQTKSNAAGSLQVYKNYLAWIEEDGNGTKLETYIIDRDRQGNEESIDGSTVYGHMAILDVQAQPLEPENPCAFMNGDCEQICVTKLENDKFTKVCECSLGFVLQNDQLTCGSDNVFDEFALITDSTNDRIFQIDLKTDKTYALHYEEDTGYFGVFYNKLTRKVIWSELLAGTIHASDLDGENAEELIDNGNGQVEKFALDETTGNLFYTYNVYPTDAKIGVLTPGGAHRFLSLSVAFPSTFFFSGIDVHPKRGLLFFTAGSHYYDSRVVRANMDGSNVTLLNMAIQDDFSLPEGVAVDHVNDRLYWADYYQDKIYSCDLDGADCGLLVDEPSKDIKDVTTDGQFVYYTAWNAHHLSRVNITNTMEDTEVGSNLALGRLEVVSVYRSSAPNTQKLNPECKAREGRGKCSVFCLPTEKGAVCACETGDKLSADGRTCPGEKLCDEAFNQIVGSLQVLVKIEQSCYRYVGDVCKYSCPVGFKLANSSVTELTCTSASSWDKQVSHQLCEAIYCPDGLVNGRWSAGCDRRSLKSCSYTCNSGYRATSTGVTCNATGQWNEDTSALCSSEICIQAIKFGEVNNTCTRSNGEVCSYYCVPGYRLTKNAPSALTCNVDGSWSTDPDTLCEPITCPTTVVNGRVNKNCKPSIRAVCGYSCNKGFYKSSGLSSLTCLESGKWDSNGLSPCSAICTADQFKCETSHKCIPLSKQCDKANDCLDKSDELFANCSCPTTLDKASFQSDCDFRIDSTCNYGCHVGYKNTVPELKCDRNSKTWTPSSPCEEVFCSRKISNGNISAGCDRKVKSACGFVCSEPFLKDPNITQVVCGSNGVWSQMSGLCLNPPNVVSPRKGKKGSAATAGIVAGVIVVVLVVVALAVALVVFRRRLGFFKKDSPYSTASFSNAGSQSVAIENPGYMTADLRMANGMDEPYIDTAMKDPPYSGYSGVPEPVVDHNDVDTGIANPLYFNTEPLAMDTEISGPNSEHAILTTDSWLREMEKGPDEPSNNNNNNN